MSFHFEYFPNEIYTNHSIQASIYPTSKINNIQQVIFVFMITNWIDPTRLYIEINTLQFAQVLWEVHKQQQYHISYIQWSIWLYKNRKEIQQLLKLNPVDFQNNLLYDSDCITM